MDAEYGLLITLTALAVAGAASAVGAHILAMYNAVAGYVGGIPRTP